MLSVDISVVNSVEEDEDSSVKVVFSVVVSEKSVEEMSVIVIDDDGPDDVVEELKSEVELKEELSADISVVTSVEDSSVEVAISVVVSETPVDNGVVIVFDGDGVSTVDVTLEVASGLVVTEDVSVDVSVVDSMDVEEKKVEVSVVDSVGVVDDNGSSVEETAVDVKSDVGLKDEVSVDISVDEEDCHVEIVVSVVDVSVDEISVIVLDVGEPSVDMLGVTSVVELACVVDEVSSIVSVVSEKLVDVLSVIVFDDVERFVDDDAVDVTSGVVEEEEISVDASVDDDEILVNVVVSVFSSEKSVLSVTELGDDETSVDVLKDDVKSRVELKEELSIGVSDVIVEVASVTLVEEEVWVDISVVFSDDDEDSVTVVTSVVDSEKLVDEVSLVVGAVVNLEVVALSEVVDVGVVVVGHASPLHGTVGGVNLVVVAGSIAVVSRTTISDKVVET